MTLRTPRSRKRTLTTTALSVAIAVVLAACGTGDNAADLTSKAALPGPQQTNPATATPSHSRATAAPPPSSTAVASVLPTQAVTKPTPAPNAYRDPTRLDVVVNKQRPVKPLNFVPSALTLPQVNLATAPGAAKMQADAAAALEDMFAAAAANGIGLTVVSGYRSYQDQAATYNHWVAVHGSVQRADGVSARPGYSEHQTGLAFDVGQSDGVCTLLPCFRDTAAGQWMDEHAHRYGFILRYPPGQEQVTGFQPEYWHFRYVGLDISTDMHSNATPTLETYFGLPAAPSY
ncbi:M15 family metallopeptidase [Arthrobacter roseus]|uniref:M15 family metallopeptidase n=1 Tax=Arthrobacter roseus TaxID=136274 RepID=UPI0019660C4A|nr:M15 family metallopeptidase [Arthrobacter roseus]MBM7849280.1 D-alanyl-D-alanine carboxypeptidase [Arthrobacter roseus]